MKGGILPCLLWLCLCVFTASVSGDSLCQAEIQFLTVDVQLQQSSTNVPFRVVSNCSERLSSYHLNIKAYYGRTVNDSGLGGKVLCSIKPSRKQGEKCGCDASMWCYVTLTFLRHPYMTWKLTDVSRRIIPKTVTFNLTYPTILEHFHLTHHEDRSSVTVNKGNAIQFNWQWLEGNPQRRILLLGPDNSTLKEVDVTDGRRSYMRHTIKNISCSDGGQYRCQVEGTEEVKSLTVLVRCPLTFKEPAVFPTKHVVSGEDATFSFRATSYTHNVRSCQLKKPDDTTIGCNSSSSDVTVTGPLPDVDVIVTLKDVTERDEGTWQLIVSNPTPSDEAALARRFIVFVKTRQLSRDRVPLWIVIVSVGLSVFIVIVVVVVVVAICLCRRKAKVAKRK
ncbi:uncharacterized protein LOC143291391 [Babylonia areolata]|uniref:uncharacterized protein LOC143291391 n=1 Tax=Babylonia areolata TaxID=304850 RepID=UPI003FD67351